MSGGQTPREGGGQKSCHLYTAAPSCDDDDKSIALSVAVDHDTRKTTSAIKLVTVD